MPLNEEKLFIVIEKLDLLEKHISRHWLEMNEIVDKEEVKLLDKELRALVQELNEIYKMVKVFK